MAANEVPDGYQRQPITSVGDTGPGYISKDVLAKWLTDHKDTVGDKASFQALRRGSYVVTVKQELTLQQLRELKELSHPEYYDPKYYYEE